MLQFIINISILLIISVVMLLRANDLGERAGFRWHVRRAGFVLAGCSPIGICLKAVATGEWGGWYLTLFFIGLLLVFMTTPYLPPFWKWFWGDLTTDPAHPSDSLLHRLWEKWWHGKEDEPK